MEKDKLEQLWKIQLEFNEKFYKNKIGKNLSEMSLDDRVQWSKNQLLSIVKEAMEVLDELPNWKEHRIVNSQFIPSNLYEEIIDVNKFSVGLAQLWGMTMEQYYEEYLRKSYVVEQRYYQEHDIKLIDKDAKVAGIDIDGVLGDYENWFLKYCKDVHNLEYSTIKELKNGIHISDYEDIKSQYRQSGWKAKMPPCISASKFTHSLKEKGYKVLILTARPYKEYYTIYPDTLKFLNDNDIYFDGIIFNEEKHLKIIKEFPNLSFMVEDDIEVAKQISKLGYKVYLKINEFNYDEFVENKLILELNDVKTFATLDQIIDKI